MHWSNAVRRRSVSRRHLRPWLYGVALTGLAFVPASMRAQSPYLVRDINPGVASADPAEFVELNGHLLFPATDAATGRELWTSDGTPAGTVQLADINPGPADSAPAGFVIMGGALYFAASDGVAGRELWRADGTAAGTGRVADLNPGPPDADPRELSVANGLLFFTAVDPTYGREVFVSSGTAAGTLRLTNSDIVPEIAPGVLEPSSLRSADSRLYFFIGSAGLFESLWVATGGAPSTLEVTHTDEFYSSMSPADSAGADGDLFHVRYDVMVVPGCGPLIGCIRATVSLVQVDGLSMTPLFSRLELTSPTIHGIWPFAGDVFFNLVGSSDAGLWRAINGGLGPVRIAALAASDAVATDTLLYFRSQGLWRSDGSAAGTQLVTSLDPSNMRNVDGTLYFSAPTALEGAEPWSTDGVPAHTTLLADINRGPADSNPAGFIQVGGRLFFAATEASSGRELWGFPANCADGLPDSDGDGLCDAVDPCTAVPQAVVDSPVVVLRNIAPPAGDDRLAINARVSLPGLLPLDPAQRGLRIQLRDAHGAAAIDVTIAGGSGWRSRTIRRRHIWTYTDGSDSPPGGIYQVRVWSDLRGGPLRVSVRGRNGTYPVDAAGLPLTLSLVFDPPTAQTGQCGEVTFAAAACRFNTPRPGQPTSRLVVCR
jgi:ELWxxDGT repeat protein